MVLQAERSSIHGHATPGAVVTLTASPPRAGFPAKITANMDGIWTVEFGPQASNLVPSNITVRSGAGIVTLSRVLWGDVILCSGQSNMGVPTSYILNSSAAIAAATTLTKSVRLLRVSTGTGQATSPQTDVALQLGWSKVTPTLVSGFSAVCWTFALGLANRQPGEFAHKRPLGLVLSAVGGTPLEAWLTADSAAKCPGVPASAGCSHRGNVTSGLFNEQIAPLRGMVFKLAIWYQGESNALWGQFPNYAHTGISGYTCRYAQLIQGYRSALDFVGRQGWLTVQIAPWLGQHTHSVFPSIRFSQQAVGDETPGVATVVIQDLGDPNAPVGSMHPRDKYEVGSRLAAAAIALEFIGVNTSGHNELAINAPQLGSTLVHPSKDGTTDSAWGGPAFVSITRDGPAAFSVQLARAAGLQMVGSRGCANVSIFDDGSERPPTQRCCDAPDTFQLWPTLNATQQRAPWTGVSGPDAHVECTVAGTGLNCTTPEPINGSWLWTFAWQNFPACMLVNDARLPASPMRVAVPHYGAATPPSTSANVDQ